MRIVHRLISQVSDWFGEYSISLLNGRFRAASLRSRKEAVEHQAETGRPYLIGWKPLRETMALARKLGIRSRAEFFRAKRSACSHATFPS